MQTDFSIGRCSRRCAVSGKPLEPGEWYISAVIGDGDDVVRKDISAAHWNEPPENTIGWWRSRMPTAQTKKLRPAPNGVLLDTLTELLDRPGKESLAYLLALLLCRRRVLQDEAEAPEPEGDSHVWNVTCPGDGRQWSVPVAVPTADVVEAIQTELNSLLFTEE
jgi:hypothetical protein